RFLVELYRHRRLREPGLAQQLYSELEQASPDWFRARGLDHARESLVPVANGAQFGPTEPAVSAGYVLRLLALLLRFPLRQQLALALPQLGAGNQALWRRIAENHDVRLGASVRRVRRVRRGSAVAVETTAGELEFDQLIWTAPM